MFAIHNKVIRRRAEDAAWDEYEQMKLNDETAGYGLDYEYMIGD